MGYKWNEIGNEFVTVEVGEGDMGIHYIFSLPFLCLKFFKIIWNFSKLLCFLKILIANEIRIFKRTEYVLVVFTSHLSYWEGFA